MASVSIPDENREITDPAEIREFLAPFGLWYEKWDVEGRIGPDATNEEILEAYKPEIDRLKETGGFVTADVINVTPGTEGLEAMLNKFNKEHTHDEDEVRFTVKGSGVFHVHPENGPVFGITVESVTWSTSLVELNTGSTCATIKPFGASACLKIPADGLLITSKNRFMRITPRFALALAT